MNRALFIVCLCLSCWMPSVAQDTFSIVAVDSMTGEVGSAGASCVDLFGTGYSNHFLGDLIPGVGAINTQAYYLAGNQTNARTRMVGGDSPQQVIDWLVANDIQGNPNIRQYGVVGLVNGSPQAAAHTGVSTNDFKGHRVGPNYSIQGNILLGAIVLDSMEARFNAATGDLSCKLMAAMQGANMVGADTRCTSNGSSSLFAFVKVSQPTDPDGAPSFLVSVKTHSGAGIEPIDTLQTLFDAVKNCTATAVAPALEAAISIFPNPATNSLHVDFKGMPNAQWQLTVWDAWGRQLATPVEASTATVDVSTLAPGIYLLRGDDGAQQFSRVFLK